MAGQIPHHSDSYSIPCMKECINPLGGPMIFSALDANSSFWHVEVADEDYDKIAYAPLTDYSDSLACNLV